MIGILVALLAALVNALAAILIKREISESSVIHASLVITLIGGFIVWPLALVSVDLTRINLSGVLVFAIAGMLAPGLGRLFYFTSIEKLGASITASVWATFPIYTTISAVLFLNETLSTLNWIGIICVIVGVLVIERSSKRPRTKSSWFSKKQFVIPIIGTLFMASASVIRKYGLNFYNEPILGTAIGYISSLTIYLLYIGVFQSKGIGAILKKDGKRFWKAAVAVAATSTLIYYALSLEQVAIVTPILQVNVLFTILFAYFFLKDVERISLMTGISALAIFFGILLLGS